MTVVSQIVILIFVHYNYLLETTVQSLFTSIACKFLGLGPVVLFFSELMVSELSIVSAFVVMTSSSSSSISVITDYLNLISSGEDSSSRDRERLAKKEVVKPFLMVTEWTRDSFYSRYLTGTP